MGKRAGETRKGDERFNHNPDNRKRKPRVAGKWAEAPAPAAKRKARPGAMAVERPSGEARGNRRHATEGGNTRKKKGS